MWSANKDGAGRCVEENRYEDVARGLRALRFLAAVGQLAHSEAGKRSRIHRAKLLPIADIVLNPMLPAAMSCFLPNFGWSYLSERLQAGAIHFHCIHCSNLSLYKFAFYIM
jgi:hypothetical protein